jgi:hypothetical protein
MDEDDPVTVFDTTTGQFVQARAGSFVTPPGRPRHKGLRVGRFDWAWFARRRLRMLLPSTQGRLWDHGHEPETAAALRAAKKLADTANGSS